MRDKELLQLGIPRAALETARGAIQDAVHAGMAKKAVSRMVRRIARDAATYESDAHFGALARILLSTKPTLKPAVEREALAPYQQWGTGLDPASVEQMRHACSLPIAMRGALMPDAHVGYGLPIGGVLATRGAVIPYAVGVDIACRMKMTVLERPPKALEKRLDVLKRAIEEETRFGVGSAFHKNPRKHAVMDRDWSITSITKEMKDKAWSQLGSSGGGNHFVEFGSLEVMEEGLGLEPGVYLALLSHSGSRGAGARVCDYYSKVARQQHADLPGPLRHLAWLDLDSEAGQEYWAAMQLMGEYAAANHACIHRHIAEHLGDRVLLSIENHHNFAWKEQHDGEEVVVHRKGATPAGKGVLGIIPGSMATPGYVVRGKGKAESMNSAAHGAGRVMSRKQAKKNLRWKDAKRFLEKERVTLMGAGIDEVPMVYKDIEEVMAAQADLVEILARFQPRLVKMAGGNEGARE